MASVPNAMVRTRRMGVAIMTEPFTLGHLSDDGPSYPWHKIAKPICPRCGGFIPNNERPGEYPGALSRVDNETEICSACGVAEAMQGLLERLSDESSE